MTPSRNVATPNPTPYARTGQTGPQSPDPLDVADLVPEERVHGVEGDHETGHRREQPHDAGGAQRPEVGGRAHGGVVGGGVVDRAERELGRQSLGEGDETEDHEDRPPARCVAEQGGQRHAEGHGERPAEQDAPGDPSGLTRRRDAPGECVRRRQDEPRRDAREALARTEHPHRGRGCREAQGHGQCRGRCHEDPAQRQPIQCRCGDHGCDRHGDAVGGDGHPHRRYADAQRRREVRQERGEHEGLRSHDGHARREDRDRGGGTHRWNRGRRCHGWNDACSANRQATEQETIRTPFGHTWLR